MATSQGTQPDPLLPSGFSSSPLSDQASQQDEIAIIQYEDPTLPPINGVLGGLPVAERNSEYFIIAKEVGDTSPEIIGQSQFKIIYLCDSQLNVAKPSAGGGPALLNVNQNFERQKNAVVRVNQGTVLNQQLAGTHKITAVGSLEPIGGSQIGTSPLAYVTTMSFVPTDQLGVAPGLQVETYYYWLNKTVGYQNTQSMYRTSGEISSNLIPSGADGTWSKPNAVQASGSGTSNGLRTYYDVQQNLTTGSAVTGSNDVTLWSENYQDGITILTGSVQGNTRVRVSCGVGVNIATSSIADFFRPAFGAGTGKAGGGEVSFSTVIKLKVYRDVGGLGADIQLIGETQKSLNLNNPFLVPNGSYNWNRANGLSILDDPSDSYDDFSWSPNKAAFPAIITDYFDVTDGDKIYARLELPEENTASVSFENNGYFTASLYRHKDRAALRSYQYFGGHLIMNQETPPGANFVNGVTGITASYFTTQSDGISVSQSIWNYTGSYWIGYNNFSSSEEGIGSYVTASTPLTNFYGGEYVQVNPGTETYNEYNANGNITASLGSGVNKTTWLSFGFNPIKLPFVPVAGDFIRFEYIKSKVYLITQVQSVGNVLKLKLDNQIPESTVLDNFVIYRIVEDGQYIILDVEKNTEVGVDQTFSGLITPEFPSVELEARAETLFFDLKQANIIED